MSGSDNLENAIEAVQAGGVVVAPTETFYALVGSAFQPAVIDRIFEIKERETGKSLPVIAADIETVKREFSLPGPCSAAIDAFWPGPLSLVLTPSSDRLDHLKASDGTVAVRVSPCEQVLALARACEGLVTSTSANLSGEPSIAHVSGLSPKVAARADAIVDGGTTPGGQASTIAAWTDAGWVIFREGPVSREALHKTASSA